MRGSLEKKIVIALRTLKAMLSDWSYLQNGVMRDERSREENVKFDLTGVNV